MHGRESGENPPFRDPASYYAGVLPLGIALLLSPALWMFLWVTFANGGSNTFSITLAYALYGIVMLASLLLPWDMKLLRQACRAALASFPLSAIAYGCVYILSSMLEKAAKRGLGSGVGAYFKSISISIDYIFITIQLCCLVPVVCFAVLLLLRRYWRLSFAVLFAVANLPFWITIVVLFSLRFVA
jgi:hypothetical protein